MALDTYLDKYTVHTSRDDNHIHIRKFGTNPLVGVTQETIWTRGGVYTGFLTAADTVLVSAGGNVNDTAAGTGARKVLISGLDENWDIASEEVTLAGASASAATTTTFIRVNRVIVTEVGTYGGTNAGLISVATSGGIVVAEVAIGIGQTEMLVYTIPNGYRGFVTRITASSETNKPVEIRGHARLDADNTVTSIRPERVVFKRLAVAEEFFIEFTTPDQLPPKTDFWVSGVKTSAGDAEVYAELDIHMVRII